MVPSQYHKMTPLYSELQVSRTWHLSSGIGGRFFKKMFLVASCISIILFLSSLDPGGVTDYEEQPIWHMNAVEMNDWLGNMSVKMETRRKHLQHMCAIFGLDRRKNDSLHQPNVWEFLINRKHQLVWCNVFKAASTSWMYNFNILAGYKPRFLQSTKQVPLQLARKKYSRPTLTELLAAQNDSSTFLIVRHPLERLLSGYRDKIENALAHTYHHKLNNYIIQRFRNTTEKKKFNSKKRGRVTRPTFPEFVNYLIDQHKNEKEFDMHWTPINTFCTPCQVKFDIIMKFESLEEDQNYLIHSRKLEKWIRPQWKNPSKGRSKTSSLVEEYYSQLTPRQIQKLFHIYRYDFMLFNYTLEGFTAHMNYEISLF